MLFWLLFSQYIINVTKYSTKKRTTNEVDDETQKKSENWAQENRNIWEENYNVRIGRHIYIRRQIDNKGYYSKAQLAWGEC